MSECEQKEMTVAKTQFNCPVEATLEVLGGKWKVLILFHLRNGSLRFNELRRLIPHITDKMLAQQLRQLEVHRVVSRTVFAVIPPKVVYALTPYGQTLKPITQKMCEWGKKHMLRKS